MKIRVIFKKIKYTFLLMLWKRIVTYHQEKVRTIIIERKQYKRDITPKIIWIYWDDPELPYLISSCINKICQLNEHYKVNVVTKDNLTDYLPGLSFSDNGLTIQLKADIIRLELIYRYGGIWVDASILFFEDLGCLTRIADTNKYDFIGFYRQRLSNDSSMPIIENWMFSSPPKNKFIGFWLEEFRPAMLLGLEKYHEYLKERHDYLELKQKINIPVYLSAYIAAQIAAKKVPDFCAYLICAEDTAYFYHEHYPQRNYFLRKVWCEYQAPSCIPPLIKLTSQNRSTIEKRVCLNQGSIFEKFIRK